MKKRVADASCFDDLIYDVGMHNGDDTAFYLHQGYRVLAIEADPHLVSKARERFASAIQTRRLTILNIGIAEESGAKTFWICDSVSVWSSFKEKIASRSGSKHHAIQVPTRRFRKVLDEFGVPVYLKIDIEGYDHLCVRDLKGNPLPKFISLESECVGDDEDLSKTESLATLSLLYEVGYRRFKLISQYDFRALTDPDRFPFLERVVRSAAEGRLRLLGLSRLAKLFTHEARLGRKNRYHFAAGSTGPWGHNTPGRWVTFEEARETYLKTRDKCLRKPDAVKHSFWCDWHATF
jgi:FkbM family methyltransferase